MRKWFENLAEVRQPFIKHHREQMKQVLETETSIAEPIKIIPPQKNYVPTVETRERIPMFEKIKADANAWQPKFIAVDDIHEVADMINKYHDDYPLRVDKTIELIENYLRKRKP